MGNCLSTCKSRSDGDGGEEGIIAFSGGKLIGPTKDTVQLKIPSSGNEQDSKDFSIVQKELEALQSQISHSQAVLASLKFTFLENCGLRESNDKINRTTQTTQDPNLPKSLDDFTSKVREAEGPEHAKSCPAIANIAVQTDGRVLQNCADEEYFLPPIDSSPLDIQRHKEQVLSSIQGGLELDIYRSCRKLSVLPEEETDDSPPNRLAPSRFTEQQAHSFDSYLLRAGRSEERQGSAAGVVRQHSDPTPTPSTRRPLQLVTLLEITQPPRGVKDSGLGSELRVASPTPSTTTTAMDCYRTAMEDSPDNSLSWQTLSYDPSSPIRESRSPARLLVPEDGDDRAVSPSPTLCFLTPTEGSPDNSLSCLTLTFDSGSPFASPQRSPRPSPRKSPRRSPKRSPHKSPMKTHQKPSQKQTFLAPTTVPPCGQEDSGLGSETRMASPSPTTPCYKTPPASPSSDNSLSWTTPTDDSGSPDPEHALLSALMDPGGVLAGPTTTSASGLLARSSSRRRLVRSLARIGSEAILGSSSLSEIQLQPNTMDEPKDGKEDLPEGNQQAFPNLTDADLKKLGLWIEPAGEDKEGPAEEEHIQNKYTSLVLAFKTDKMTLSRRLELQNKLRDQAELNMTHEVETLKSAIQLLGTLSADFERNDSFEKIILQIEALYKSALRVSSTAEMYGAVQQENRVSKAIDIILKYVENLRLIYEKEKSEHEETRKLLRESKTPSTAQANDSNKRRASIAVFQQRSPSESSTPTFERRGSSSKRGSQLRRSTLTKNDSQSDIRRNSSVDGDPFDNIYEGCETCGSRLRPELDSNGSQPNSSDESSEEETKIFKRRTSFKEENLTRRLSSRQKFRKRTSFSAPLWVQRISKSMQWLEPYEDFALQVRYFVASLFVIAAFLIVAASFFQGQGN